MTMFHQRNRCAQIVKMIAGGLTLAASMAAGPALADFDATVVVRDLDTPTGITYTGIGAWVVLSEIPTPGVPGDMGGRNRVLLVNLETGVQEELSFGEPEPLNLDVDRFGNAFWTCKTAGVILYRTPDGKIEKLLEDLDAPSGIARFGKYLLFTETPDPGQNSEENTVSVYDGNMVMELSTGEPEPTDIAVGVDGTLYWTCKSAGVILKRTPDGQKSVVLENLSSPTGIATDQVGNFYFTEVPTPGVPGDQGGENKVWRYNIDSGMLDLVNEGDPEPSDITVSPNGSHIIWTCTSAGVVVVAQER